jgi:hypothetical protein
MSSLGRVLLTFVTIAVALGGAGAAQGSSGDWNERDFRLRTITADLGSLGSSSLEFSGTMTQQAREAGLYPHFRFRTDIRITCQNAANPVQTLTRTSSLDSRSDATIVVGTGNQFTNLEAGTIKWTATFTFAVETEGEFWAFFWCQQAGYVVRDVVATGASGIAWLSVINLSPMPGTSLYQYEIPAGASVLRFTRHDGTGF